MHARPLGDRGNGGRVESVRGEFLERRGQDGLADVLTATMRDVGGHGVSLSQVYLQ